eukprot:552097-Amphidinium_carterae.2
MYPDAGFFAVALPWAGFFSVCFLLDLGKALLVAHRLGRLGSGLHAARGHGQYGEYNGKSHEELDWPLEERLEATFFKLDKKHEPDTEHHDAIM